MMEKISVVVTIDTEEEGLWSGSYCRDFEPVENIKGIPAFQKICDKYQIRPTYLCTYSICKTPWARDMLLPIADAGKCEIGGHLHPWNTPPFEEVLSKRNSLMCHLPFDLVSRKLDTLLEGHQDCFGSRPTSFRSGRWGFDEKTAKGLVEKRFLVDSSVCPFIDYSSEGISLCDRKLPDLYWLSLDDIFREDITNRGLLEVPPTIGFNITNYELAHNILKKLKRKPFTFFHIVGVLSRLSLLHQVSLSPEMCNLEQMKICAIKHVEGGNRILNIFFHSSDLLPGYTPYVKNINELKAFLNKLDSFFGFLVNTWNVEGLRLSDIYNQID